MRQKLPIELIAIDLDGTLLNSRGFMTVTVEAMIKKAMSLGIRIVVATGKTRFAARDVIARLRLGTPGVYVQGTVIHNADGTIRRQVQLPIGVARSVIRFAEESGHTLLAFSGARLLTQVRNPYTDRLVNFAEPSPEAVGPLRHLVGNIPINKLLFAAEAIEIHVLRGHLTNLIGDRAVLVQAVNETLEILPRGASKGAAVAQLLKDFQVSPERVLAIGDADNDVEMLQLAGLAVVVYNATPNAKAVADWVVASNDADGVAEAIERFVIDGAPHFQ